MSRDDRSNLADPGAATRPRDSSGIGKTHSSIGAAVDPCSMLGQQAQAGGCHCGDMFIEHVLLLLGRSISSRWRNAQL